MTMHLTATLNVQADVQTINGNLYPRDVLAKALAHFQKRIADGMAVGTFGPCPESKVDIHRAAFVVRDLKMKEDGHIVAEVQTLETPIGAALEEAVTQVEFTTVGIGKLDEKRTVTEFELTGITAVPKEVRP